VGTSVLVAGRAHRTSAMTYEAGPSRVQARPEARINSMLQRERGIGNPVPPRLLTIAQAARELDVSPSTIRSWLDYGRLKPVRLPSTRPGHDSRLVRVDRTQLEALIEASRC
jgi:excisionase family DNA binding protein